MELQRELEPSKNLQNFVMYFLNCPLLQFNAEPFFMITLQVCDFVKSLPGCSDYVEDFQLQEIDGQALMLLKADHLMSAMAIKLGPALKICSAIDAMREELKQVICDRKLFV